MIRTLTQLFLLFKHRYLLALLSVFVSGSYKYSWTPSSSFPSLSLLEILLLSEGSVPPDSLNFSTSVVWHISSMAHIGSASFGDFPSVPLSRPSLAPLALSPSHSFSKNIAIFSSLPILRIFFFLINNWKMDLINGFNKYYLETSMVNYSAQSVAQLKDFVLNNNIRMASLSGKWGGLIRSDYLFAIKQWSDSLPSESIILCEWFLVNSTERCGRPSSLGGNVCSLHIGRIRTGKSPPVHSVKCSRGTKSKTRICTRCGGSSLLFISRSRRHLRALCSLFAD